MSPTPCVLAANADNPVKFYEIALKFRGVNPGRATVKERTTLVKHVVIPESCMSDNILVPLGPIQAIKTEIRRNHIRIFVSVFTGNMRVDLSPAGESTPVVNTSTLTFPLSQAGVGTGGFLVVIPQANGTLYGFDGTFAVQKLTEYRPGEEVTGLNWSEVLHNLPLKAEKRP